MKLLYLLLTAVFILSGPKTYAEGEFEFVRDCIGAYTTLDRSTITFYEQLDKTKEPEELKQAVQAYVATLMQAQNLLLEHSRSENPNIREVATDLRKLMADLVKNTYGYLHIISNTDLDEAQRTQKGKELMKENDFASGFFREITLGVCSAIVKEKPENFRKTDSQYIHLSLAQRNSLNEQMHREFGKSIKKGTKAKSKTPFEYSSRMIYEFINLEWAFENE